MRAIPNTVTHYVAPSGTFSSPRPGVLGSLALKIGAKVFPVYA